MLPGAPDSARGGSGGGVEERSRRAGGNDAERPPQDGRVQIWNADEQRPHELTARRGRRMQSTIMPYFKDYRKSDYVREPPAVRGSLRDDTLRSAMRKTGLGAIVLLSIFPLRLSACDCGPAGPACAYVGRASVAFVGTVTFTDHDPTMGLRQRTFVRFHIEEVFKGVSSDVPDVWVDPGSFTSCYAEYHVGERLLVFGYGGLAMPPDTAAMSVVPGQVKPKPLPEVLHSKMPTLVYLAPECSGTRQLDPRDRRIGLDLEYLRQFKAGTAGTSVRGRVTEDSRFGIFGVDPIPGLGGARVVLTGNGIRRSTATDDDGYYAISGVAPGSYAVQASLRHYSSPWLERDVMVPAMGCGAADFDMIGSSSIEGTLVDSAQRPAVNVRVEILRLNGNGNPIYYAQKETTTDQAGNYRLDQLPKGDFQIGVNLFRPPDPKTPYLPTRWSSQGSSVVRLSPGEDRHLSVLRLPPPSTVREVETQVLWPDGRPAEGVTVWGGVGDHAATSSDTDASGIARLKVLEGVHYAIEAKVWIGSGEEREVARSGASELTPGTVPIHLKLVLAKRTKQYH